MADDSKLNREETAWRKVKTSEKFENAFRGLKVFWKTTYNLYIHLLVALVVVVSGFYFQISALEWIALIFAIGFVVVTEAINTAIEIDIDLTSPEYHPFARDTKDVAAGAVLIASGLAVIIGVIVFLPKVIQIVQ
jgi:diacylglycerol kinase